MSLFLIATPLGNYGDITVRGKEVLSQCDFVIGEEFRPTSTLLKKIGLEQKEIYELNEHTRDRDLGELVELCRKHKVAFVSDCGTPNFCDPGYQLISRLRKEKIEIVALPGPSSVALIISLASAKIESFVFEGFLPADREKRTQKIEQLKSETRPVILLETPYRVSKLLQELAAAQPGRKALLGLDLTLPTEKVEEGSLKSLAEKIGDSVKAEPVLLLY